MSDYRAIRSSYGFRGRFWDLGDVAEGVSEAEAKVIPEHFELIPKGVSTEVPMHKSFEPPEPTTLSEIHEKTIKADKKSSRK